MAESKHLTTIWNVCVGFWLLNSASGHTGSNLNGQNQNCSKLSSCFSAASNNTKWTFPTTLPTSELEVTESCRQFNKVMSCVENYTKNCLSTEDKVIINSQVSPAIEIYRDLCSNTSFRTEYFKHTACLKALSNDWQTCTNEYLYLVNEEMKRNDATSESRIVELCCAQHGYRLCIYVRSQYMCTKDSARFIINTTKRISKIPNYSQECTGVRTATCSGSASAKILSLVLLTFLSIFFLLK